MIDSPEEIFPPRKIKIVPIAGKGRGVVATEPISTGEIIEVCPTVVLSRTEVQFLKSQSDRLKFYALELLKFDRHVVQAGYGMIYNHSDSPNAEIEYDRQHEVAIVALRDIKTDEEIVFDYCFDDHVEFLNLE